MTKYKSPRILLVRNDRIGDLVLTLPAVHALRQHLPMAHLTLCVSQYAAPLVTALSDVDEVLIDDAAEKAWRFSRRLRGLKFDGALVFNTNTRNALAVRLAGIRRRVVWGYKPVGMLTATHPVKVHRSRPPIHEAEFAMRFVEKLGVRRTSGALQAKLPLDTSATKRVTSLIQQSLGREGPLFGVHPGNKNSAYNWPISNYAQLVRRLVERGRVMITGSPEERELVEHACNLLTAEQRKRVLPLTNLALPELVAATALQQSLVVSSTGPMHVAGAVGTPTVALFSPHPAHVPAKWGPLGTNHTVLVAPLLEGEDPAVPSEQSEELMARIDVGEVFHAAVRQATNPHVSKDAA
jgi:ADP-heptose:LPS heptosyltransferase